MSRSAISTGGLVVAGTTDVENLERFPAGGRRDDFAIARGQQGALGEVARVLLIVNDKYPHSTPPYLYLRLSFVLLYYVAYYCFETVLSFLLANKRQVLFWYTMR